MVPDADSFTRVVTWRMAAAVSSRLAACCWLRRARSSDAARISEMEFITLEVPTRTVPMALANESSATL